MGLTIGFISLSLKLLTCFALKAVILAGGLGTRISEEISVRPKPMVEIGGKPILWHIMKILSAHHINEFIVCCGYKGYVIKEYFANYSLHTSDITFDLSQNSVQVHRRTAEPWKITLVDTGDNTMTDGRLLRVRDYLGDSSFLFTYGDGLSDIDLLLFLPITKTDPLKLLLQPFNHPDDSEYYSLVINPLSLVSKRSQLVTVVGLMEVFLS